MPRKRKDQTQPTSRILSAWPALRNNAEQAYQLVTSPAWQLLVADLQSHREAAAERLIRLNDNAAKENQLRGSIHTIDFIAGLEATVKGWEKD